MLNKWLLLLILLVGIHYFIFICLVVSTIMSWFMLPWYIAGAIATGNTRIIVSRDECPLTTLENKIRIKLNWKKSRGFLADYILKPMQFLKSMLY